MIAVNIADRFSSQFNSNIMILEAKFLNPLLDFLPVTSFFPKYQIDIPSYPHLQCIRVEAHEKIVVLFV